MRVAAKGSISRCSTSDRRVDAPTALSLPKNAGYDSIQSRIIYSVCGIEYPYFVRAHVYDLGGRSNIRILLGRMYTI